MLWIWGFGLRPTRLESSMLTNSISCVHREDSMPCQRLPCKSLKSQPAAGLHWPAIKSCNGSHQMSTRKTRCLDSLRHSNTSHVASESCQRPHVFCGVVVGSGSIGLPNADREVFGFPVHEHVHGRVNVGRSARRVFNETSWQPSFRYRNI
jgi:hypothetical protein